MGHSNYGPHKEQVAYVQIVPNLSAFERAMGGRPKVGRGGADRAEILRGVWAHREAIREAVQEDQRRWMRALASASKAASEAFRRHAEAVRNVQEFLINNGLIEAPPPEDKWERALWMRDHRNTGPPTPAAWHQRDISPTKPRARRARGPVNQRRRRSYEFHS